MSQDEDLPLPSIRKAKHEYFRSIFNKYDTDGSGYIELKELKEMLKSDDEVPRKIVKHVFTMSDTDNDGKINYDEFILMIHNKKLKDIFGHYADTYIRYVLPPQYRHVLAVDGAVSVDEPEGIYEEHVTCCPPPITMIIISIIEFTCFLIDKLSENTKKSPTATFLVYNPYKRSECWRFFTYIFVHIGYTHLVINLTVQLLLGIVLEMVHKWWRVLLVYFLGVVAASLATSIANPTAYLAGASGGVYSIFTAHIASIIMNWNEMIFPGIQLFIFFLITAVDVSTSIYNRYWLEIDEQIGYTSHVAGAISGLLVGIWILKNFVPTKRETYIWWFALILYIVFMGTMILLNIIWKDHSYP